VPHKTEEVGGAYCVALDKDRGQYSSNGWARVQIDTPRECTTNPYKLYLIKNSETNAWKLHVKVDGSNDIIDLCIGFKTPNEGEVIYSANNRRKCIGDLKKLEFQNFLLVPGPLDLGKLGSKYEYNEPLAHLASRLAHFPYFARLHIQVLKDLSQALAVPINIRVKYRYMLTATKEKYLAWMEHYFPMLANLCSRIPGKDCSGILDNLKLLHNDIQT
jgi:hypothetical protein